MAEKFNQKYSNSNQKGVKQLMTLEDYIIDLALQIGGDEIYGADFENDTFLMHRYCWCEEDGCPWCGGCTCPDSADHYYYDGIEITYEEFDGIYDVYTRELMVGSRAWNRACDAMNKRRKWVHNSTSDYCKGTGIFAEKGALPGRNAPNFWHKPSGLRVWWYKTIGRGLSIEGNADYETVFSECAESLEA